MSASRPAVDGLLREVLAGDGKVPFARIVEQLVDLAELRELARRHAVTLKGYRIERAPRKKLLDAVLDVQRPDLVRELCTRVVEVLEDLKAPDPEPSSTPDPASTKAVEEALRRRESELTELRAELEKARSQASRQREREAGLARELEEEQARSAQQRARIEDLDRQLAQRRRRQRPAAPRSDDAARVQELERELAALHDAEEGLRRIVAVRQGRIRELEETNAELRELIPPAKRRKQLAPKAPELADSFRLPRFLPGFYKSLEGKERRSIKKAFQAALLFCTEGPGYPGLEVKQIEGQELWSLRASLKLRVYFLLRADGDVDFLALADREDQHTTLRRLKER